MQKQTTLVPTNECWECQQMKRELQEKSETLLAVTQALNTFLETGDCGAASECLLAYALRQTQSEIGFLGVVLEGPVLRILAHHGSRWQPGLKQELFESKMKQQAERGYFELDRPENLLGSVMSSGGKTVIANAVMTDPRAKGHLPGHPQVHSFLGVPIFKGEEVVGVIAVANRAGGYTGEVVGSLETICQATGVLYDNYRQSLQREQLEQQRSRLEAEFRQSQKMEVLGQLAGGIAHDFNNSLMVLSGSADLLEGVLPPNSAGSAYLEQIRRTTEKAAIVTKQLLAFSRKQVLDVKPIDVHEVLSDCECIMPRLLGSDVELTFRLEGKHSWIRADAAQIEQIIVNLAINARDAMPAGGRLTISTRDEETLAAPARKGSAVAATKPVKWMVIEVADEGCGMDEQTRAHIFEPFFTTKPVGKGTGLGLSTVYGIVHQFGGRVDVDSTVGAGTRFTLRFPVADCGVPAAVAVTSSTSAPVAGTRLTILLVDDEASLCLAIAEFLRETGHHVLDSQNPSDALELARHSKAPIDLLLTDIVMPGLRGTELAEEVRKLHPGIQVMFMSGYAEGLPELAIPAGATFLQKPFRFSSLRERLTLVKRKE
jgi:signal transduction histidine kinase